MDRIMDVPTQRISQEVRPVDRVRPSKPLSADDGGGAKPYHPPYGVVDRVTLSPEGRAMAMQQRAAQSVNPPPQLITYAYGPGRLPTVPTPRLPYEPDP
jgi:hypothetical protein